MKREVKIGNRVIGGDHPILIQSMTSTKTEDRKSTYEQIKALQIAGCEAVRVTANNLEACKAISYYKEKFDIPIIADIHFSHSLAVEAIKAGADKIRINPGNISTAKLNEIIETAQKYNIAIRIGINSGSVEREFLDKYGVSKEAMYESMKKYVSYFENKGFNNIVLSAKSSDVRLNIEVNRLISERFDYPIHLGVTEAGVYEDAIIKSAVGIGSLLADGIGDTIRVSVTGDPVKEIPIAKKILQVLGLRSGVDIVSCPTCGRCEYSLEEVALKVRKATNNLDKNIKIAVMGCAVNGPGEAKEADIGIAGTKSGAMLFKKGKKIKNVSSGELIDELLEVIEEYK